MTDSTVDTVTKAIGMGSVGFGLLAMASPSALRAAYGDSVSAGGSLDYFGRTWGSRTAVLGMLTVMADSDQQRKRVAGLAAAMNAADSLTALRAEGMPSATRRMAALTSAGFAVAAGYVALQL